MYGGPYSHETDAIRDERIRAAALGEEPNFDKLFENVELSDGAIAVLKDIENPPEETVGPFVENVKNLNVEEEVAPEGISEESESGEDQADSEEPSQNETEAERSLEPYPADRLNPHLSDEDRTELEDILKDVE
jgi:hypothetical protein